MKKNTNGGLLILCLVAFLTLVGSLFAMNTAKATAEENSVVVAEAVPVIERVVVTPTPAWQSVTKTMYVLGDRVNERSGPGTNYGITRQYVAGETVTVVAEVNGWDKLSNGNYIRSDFLTENYQEIVPHILEQHPDLIVVYLSRQYLEYWYDGQVIACGSVVTGDCYDSPTPIGLYWITSRQTEVDMMGDTSTHSKWVCYFDGLKAIHDAPWRTEYGGEIYKGDGTHKCVNCPSELAETIFNRCRVGYTYVLVLP